MHKSITEHVTCWTLKQIEDIQMILSEFGNMKAEIYPASY